MGIEHGRQNIGIMPDISSRVLRRRMAGCAASTDFCTTAKRTRAALANYALYFNMRKMA